MSRLIASQEVGFVRSRDQLLWLLAGVGKIVRTRTGRKEREKTNRFCFALFSFVISSEKMKKAGIPRRSSVYHLQFNSASNE